MPTITEENIITTFLMFYLGHDKLELTEANDATVDFLMPKVMMHLMSSNGTKDWYDCQVDMLLIDHVFIRQVRLIVGRAILLRGICTNSLRNAQLTPFKDNDDKSPSTDIGAF